MDGSNRRWIDRGELDTLCGERLAGMVLDGLWVAGTLDGLHAPCVAIVGTRAPSDDGRRRAHGLASTLGRAGVCVISGLALGIDGAAHEGALAAGAATIGVLGGGHERFFPPRHRELGTRVALSGGAVVSPFAPSVQPKPWMFLQRNAIIAALADAVVVVEAAARSGALNTAGHAADRGIPVLAFPGDVERPKAAGCNALIRDGATLVRDADDVLAALPSYLLPPRPAKRERSASARTRAPSDGTVGRDGIAGADGIAEADGGGAPDGRIVDSEIARRVMATLARGACDAGRLADVLGAAPTALFPVLSELEFAGRIACGADGYSLARQ